MVRRLQISICGAVQGVGFRPFVFRIANELHLAGYIQNTSSGIHIDAEGESDSLESFLLRIKTESPHLATISKIECLDSDPAGYSTFIIRQSLTGKNASALILPDVALCRDCLEEMFDKNNRRYLYPFINCTNCGPRFSIIYSLPYDRKNTSMRDFHMCEECRSEYEDPSDRRFHAQPIACPECGPHVELWDGKGRTIASYHESVLAAVRLLRQGKIIAVKGLGGFQLITDACNDEVINRLRERKHRPRKPFAVMFPDIESIREVCLVSRLEEKELLSVESPILLLRKRDNALQGQTRGKRYFSRPDVSIFIAPDNPYLGIMLPYTPLHHLLMKETGNPLLVTSGNITDEPMCIDEYEALERLNGIADYFLIHNRPILRYVDDSVVRVISDGIMMLRCARGYSPLPLKLTGPRANKTILAAGGQLKNSITINVNDNVLMSQYIGDLMSTQAMESFQSVIRDFEKFYSLRPELVACDLHPDYLSTKYAGSNKDLFMVQHHIAHIASCRADNQIEGRALGISWDGTGYGSDGTIWGGEFFLTDGVRYDHFAQLRKFPLPGGETAVRDPRRSALGVVYEIYGKELWKKQMKLLSYFSEREIGVLKKMLEGNINCIKTSSMGRLFDAAAALTGTSIISTYEGEAASMLEFAADQDEQGFYGYKVEIKDKLNTVDWGMLFEEMLSESSNNISASVIAAKFHNTLVEIINAVAELSGENKIILTGGCFQNIFLLEKAIKRLQANGYTVYRHKRVPPNDGGLSLGQIDYAIKQIQNIKLRRYK
ncbi:MAG: carbamoyltransferase HypF [Ignavibacteriales bacterium]